MSILGSYTKRTPAALVLASGAVFSGYSIGAEGQTQGEVVFNTAMTGYQEILTDPSYAEQIITLTYPHIGNTGVNDKDHESTRIWAAGLVIRELSPVVSNWQATDSLSEFLKANNIVAIAGIDTRRLTRILRNEGAQSGCIITGTVNTETAQASAKHYPGLEGKDLGMLVSTDKVYEWSEPTLDLREENKKIPSAKFHVVAYDFGVKQQILRLLVDHGCRVTVVPATYSAEQVLELHPDGIFLSNGPGDPAALDYAIKNIQTLLATDIPVFGICLGLQLLALALGAKTQKMKFGHHGANHPVIDVNNQRVFITSQNHGFVIDESSLPATLSVTHRSLFDNSLQGVCHAEKPVFGFQGHPEASPGPHDMYLLFAKFIDLITERLNSTSGSQRAKTN